MAVARLTKRTVDQAQPTGQDKFVWDSDLAGFGLKVTAGGKKSYVVQYRVGGGRRGRDRRITIGRHASPWTVDQARKRAIELLGEVAGGGDPAAVKLENRRAATFSEFADRYLAEHALVHKKARSAEEDRRNLEKHIRPALGNKRLKDITQDDVKRQHLALKDRPGAANRCLALISHMFSMAGNAGLVIGPNPAKGVKRFKERKRNRFLSEVEMARVSRALVEHRETFSYAVAAAIRLLAFTGARLSEILTLRWDYIDLDHGLLRLPDSKTGEKVIYLNPPALEVLNGLVRIEGNSFVLPGRSAGEHLTAAGLQHAWKRICHSAELESVRLHDLRHSFASFGAAGGMGLPVIGALLGHARSSTTERYSHLSADPLKRASEAISGRIAAAMRGGQSDRGDNRIVEMMRKGVRP